MAVLVALFAWIVKVLVSGKISVNLSWIHIPIIVLFLVYLVSTVFSLWRYGSFWGWPQVTSESLISLLGLVLLYFLVINIFEKREIFYLMSVLVASGFLAILYGCLQLFGKFLIPIGFTRAVSFNTIGGPNSLAVFTAVLLPLIVTLIMIGRDKRLRIFFIIAAALSTILLLLINFSVSWWLVIAGSALVIAFGTQKRDVFDNRWLVLPMFFLALALLFSFFRFQIPGLPDRPIEIFLKHNSSFDIAWQALKESPIIGSGPGTFVYNFSKYKDISFNQNRFWNVRFEWPSSKFLNVLGTLGILGVLGFLALIGFFIFFGIKFLFSRVEDKEFSWTLAAGIFISFLTLTVSFFLYQSNLSLDFVWFLLMASFVGLLSSTKKEFLLKPSSLFTLGITFAFTLVFIFGLGILILEGQRYVSSLSYLKGVKVWQQGETALAIGYLERAARISPGVDLYWRELAQAYLQNINEIAQRADLSREEKTQQLQLLINQAVSSAKAATDNNQENVANWSVRGFVYQNLIGTVGGTKDWAVSSYQEALKLEPTNPYFPTQAGISLLREAQRAEEREKLLSEAKEQFEKAIEMKADYSPAHFQLAMVYQAQAKLSEMVGELEKAKNAAPFDVGLAFQLGLVYYQQGRYQEARAELERAILLNPDYANALYF
ncbi:MAG: tetratricopeptide repeat protein, partial [Candidatus Aminicenantales bacterium]